MEDAGTTILPIVDALIQKIGGLVAWIDAFVQAHPKMAEAILVGIAVFGGLMLAVGSLLLLLGPLLIAFGAMGGIVALTAIPVIAFIALLFALGAAAALNWKTMTTDTQAFWNGLIDLISNAIISIENLVQGFVTKIQNMFNAVTSMVRSISSAAGAVGGAIGGSMSSMLSMVPHFASGGIVTSPTMALVGEAGPEAIIPLSAFAGGSSLAGGGRGGGGGSVIVNILGGNYLDSNGATMIANAIGKQIVRQLHVSNFN